MKDNDGEKRRNTSTRDFICVEGNLKFLNAAKSIDSKSSDSKSDALSIRPRGP